MDEILDIIDLKSEKIDGFGATLGDAIWKIEMEIGENQDIHIRRHLNDIHALLFCARRLYNLSQRVKRGSPNKHY